MKQIQLTAPQVIETLETPLPQAEPGWVLARTLRTGICGTDVHSFFGETIFGKVFPFHIGHEVCARVEAVGPQCPGLAPGDIIVVNPFFTCGACPACCMGQENNCAHKTTIGLKGFGGFSEYVYIPAGSAFKVRGLDYDALCLAEPLATVVYGLDKLQLDPSMRVLIQGVGPIGLMFLQLVRAANVSQLVASDLSREKLDAALRLGADAALSPLLEDEAAQLERMAGFDVVIDCTGSIQSMQAAVERIGFGGQVLFFGLCSAEQTMEIKPFRLYQKDACLMTSFALNKRSFCKAVALLESGQIDTASLIDSVQPRSQLEASIRRLAAGKAVGKIIIDTTV